ncbi:MAG TPA: hypothetical protein VIZ29_03615, partial [Gaiellaceae bacterium]
NTGAVPVTLNSVTIHMPGTKDWLLIAGWVLQDPAPLAHLLTPGATWHGFADLDDIKRALATKTRRPPPWRVRVAVNDAAGRAYYASRITIS